MEASWDLFVMQVGIVGAKMYLTNCIGIYRFIICCELQLHQIIITIVNKIKYLLI